METVQIVDVARCPDCEGTDTRTLNTNVQLYAGIDSHGVEYNRIVRRRTQCKHCSRVWIVRTLEFEPPKLTPPGLEPPGPDSSFADS